MYFEQYKRNNLVFLFTILFAESINQAPDLFQNTGMIWVHSLLFEKTFNASIIYEGFQPSLKTVNFVFMTG